MTTSAPALDGLLATADRQWRALGVHRRDRLTLAADLRAELEAADADGFAPAELLGTDPAGFARRLAEEAGVARTPPRYSGILAAASLGAVLGLVAGCLLALGLHRVLVAMFDLPRGGVPIWLAVGVFYGGVAVVVVAGAVISVRVSQHDVPRVRHTATRMILLLPPALAAGIAAAAGFARALDYTLNPFAVGTEAAIIFAAFLGATALVRLWSVTTAG
jgi:hypothetical protein